MVTLTKIKEFLEPKKMAFAGASRNPKKFGAIVFKELKDRGFELFPVHPEADLIHDVPCFRKIHEIPSVVFHFVCLAAAVSHFSFAIPKYFTFSVS